MKFNNLLASVLLGGIIMSTPEAQAQGLNKRHWYFGSNQYGGNTGKMDFFSNSGGGIGNTLNISTTTNGFEGREGSLILSTPTGAMKFYTDGDKLFDENENEVTGAPLVANPSSTQPALACPVPVCDFDEYYIFVNNTGVVNSTSTHAPLKYIKYNTVTNQFVGSLTTLSSSYNIEEGMAMIPSSDDPFVYWLITRRATVIGLKLDVYKIDHTGVSTTPHHTFSDLTTQITETTTYKSSQMTHTYERGNGNQCELAISGSSNFVRIMFNTVTGQFEGSPTNHSITSGDLIYDVEYSPNGDFIYVGYNSGVTLRQVNLNANPVTVNTISGTNASGGGGIERGPDGHLYYIDHLNGQDISLRRIETPDLAYNASGFTTAAVATIDSRTHNLPEFVELPQWKAEIIIDVDDKEICPGESVTLSSHVTTLNISIDSYEWLKDGQTIAGATSADYVVSEGGTYQLIVHLNQGCTVTSNPVTITEVPCDPCNILEATAQTVIDQSITIDENTVWDDKVVIKDGVKVTVDGITLDVTTADVIFGDCAWIEFINGAHLRTSNSVFRPCDENAVWKGLHFKSSSTANVHECTFKNAEMGIFQSTNSHIRIANNLFSNCHYGYRANETNTGELTGNTFLVDPTYPSYANCNVFGRATQSFGVFTDGLSTVEQGVSNNKFINKGTGIYFYGLACYGADMVISDNEFTDNNRSIISHMTGAIGSKLHIINNRFTTTDLAIYYDDQIILWQPQLYFIENNEMSCSRTSLKSDNTLSAIHIDGVGTNSIGKISNNIIKGYEVGIRTEDAHHVDISNNEIYNAKYYGIYAKYSHNLDIACNQIIMDDKSAQNLAAGIAIYSNVLSGHNIDIHSNCVLESTYGIYLQAIHSSPLTLPNIENNFLYNYKTGIRNINHTGTINHNNSFLGYNGGSTHDIDSDQSITTLSMFGANFLNNVSTVPGSSKNYHSYASCAKDVDLAGTSDHVSTRITCYNSSSAYVLIQAMPSYSMENLKGYDASIIAGTMNGLTDEPQKLQELYNVVSGSDQFTAEDKALFDYSFFLAKGDYAKANEALLVTTMDDRNKEFQQLLLNLKKDNRSMLNLNEEELAVLQSLEDGDDYVAYKATQLLVLNENNTIYTRELERPAAPQSTETTLPSAGLVELFPNPANNEINIAYRMDLGDDAQLQIFDCAGKLLREINLFADGTTLKVDISDLKQGVYFTSIKDQGTIYNGGKFVKY